MTGIAQVAGSEMAPPAGGAEKTTVRNGSPLRTSSSPDHSVAPAAFRMETANQSRLRQQSVRPQTVRLARVVGAIAMSRYAPGPLLLWKIPWLK